MDIADGRLLSEVDGGPLPPAPHSGLYQALIETSFVQHAHNDAIISMHQTSDLLANGEKDRSTPVKWTYGQLEKAARALAARLRRLGHGKEDKLVTILPNQIEWSLLFCTAIILRTTFVPLFPNVLTNSTETEHLFKTIGSATIFVKNAQMAEEVEKCLSTQHGCLKIKCLVDDGHEKPTWLSLRELVHSPSLAKDFMEIHTASSFSIIIFTSGTTALPKACLVTEKMLLEVITTREIDGIPTDKFCLPLPGNHIFCIDVVLWMWCVGGCVVYPSITFTAESTLHALETVQCTRIALVPAMLHAILEHPRRGTTDLSHLKQVVAGAAAPSKSLIERTMSKEDGLGAQVFFNGYGMTEANCAITSKGFGSMPIHNGRVRTGKVVSGAKARICKPGTREVVLRGERGDLHNGGSRVVHGYLNADSSCFYQDESDPENWWIVSGDQAEMDEDGVITVIGRYKDLIIRGGENISPTSIESVLDSVDGVKAQVVGYPDEVAGEVPVYVIWTADAQPTSHDLLLELVHSRMGTRYSPKAILHIKHDLGLDIWPTTTSGKPRKAEIKTLVKDFLDQREEEEFREQNTLVQVAQMWASLSGMKVESVLQNQHDLNQFADSLMLMQFVSLVRKRLRKSITVSDLAVNRTVTAQAKLIDSLAPISSGSTLQTYGYGPPQFADMAHCYDESDVESTVMLVEETIKPFGLSWAEDVEAVLPTYDFARIQLRKLRPQSWNHRQEYITSHANVIELRTALEHMLANQPMFRTFGVQLSAPHSSQSPVNTAIETGELLHDGTVAHVIVRPSKHYFDLIIRDGFEVEHPEDLCTLILNDPVLDHACYPGPLMRFCLVKIISTGTAGLLLQGNHSVFDATSMSFLEDLNQILDRGMSSVQPHASYKMFADLYHLHRRGPSATRDAEFFANRLIGINQLVKDFVLWPRQIAPEWFHGDFPTWQHPDGRPGKSYERPILDQEHERVGVTGVTKTAHLPGLPVLKARHNVPASLVMKAACAIFNIRHTPDASGVGEKLDQSSHTSAPPPPAVIAEAIFTSVIAARKWPFEEDYTSEQRRKLPDIMDMPGPCVECVINRIPVSPDETALSFMTTVQNLQDLDIKHAHAPLSLIRSLLSPEDAKQLIPLLRRQIFNWLPLILTSDNDDHNNVTINNNNNKEVNTNSLQSQTQKQNQIQKDMQAIRLIRFIGRDDVGIRWNAALIDDAEHVQLTASYDDAQLRKGEMEENVAEFLQIATWLSDEDNWGKTLREMS